LEIFDKRRKKIYAKDGYAIRYRCYGFTMNNMTLCPICGETNNCVMELEKSTGQKHEPCWCFSVEFPRSLLNKLPEGAEGCICNQCVTAEHE